MIIPLPSQTTQKIHPADEPFQLAAAFIRQWRLADSLDLELIDRLGRQGLADDPAVAVRAVSALYSTVIEGLCDDFSSSGVDACNQVLLRLFNLVRPLAAGQEMDRVLTSLNYDSADQLLNRYKRIQNRQPLSGTEKKKIKKIFILSRVTVGADVAITSVFVQRLLFSFPRAELVLLGPGHLKEIFHGMERVCCLDPGYHRRGSLVERLTFWPDLYQFVRQHWRNLKPDEVLFFDPDSRLSQLGLLPLLPEEATCYFNSRQTLELGDEDLSLSQMVNSWLNFILTENRCCPPVVLNKPNHEQAARDFYSQCGSSVSRVAVNLGVGGDGRKRVADPFEEQLLFSFLQKKETLLFLDSGCDADEKLRVEKLAYKARELGIAVDRVQEAQVASKKISFSHGMIIFEGGISILTAMIRQNHVFFGYDSCCQHLVTAIGVPAVIGFAGAPHQRFRARWQPRNMSGSTITIPIENNEPDPTERDLLIKKIVTAMGRAGKYPAACMCNDLPVSDHRHRILPRSGRLT